MKTRIITAGVGLVVLALVLFTFDTILFHCVVSVVTLIATHEVYNALGFGKKELPLFWVQIPYIFILMNGNIAWMRDLSLFSSYLVMLFYAVYLVLRKGKVQFKEVSGFVAFSAVVVFCFYSLVHLKTLFPVAAYQYDAIFFIMLSLSFAWGGDTCAYFAGRFLGKRKLCPAVSPHKTVEGAIGGVLGAMCVGVLVTFVYITCSGRAEQFSHTAIGVSMYLVVAILGFFGGILGIFGDLFASVVKRQCDLKDYGTLFPGHGGLLDRFDSVLFIAPFVTIMLSYVR